MGAGQACGSGLVSSFSSPSPTRISAVVGAGVVLSDKVIDTDRDHREEQPRAGSRKRSLWPVELPDAGAGRVLAFLTPGPGLGTTASTSRSWSGAARHPELWRLICTRGTRPLVRPDLEAIPAHHPRGSLSAHRKEGQARMASWRTLAQASRHVHVVRWNGELPPSITLDLVERLAGQGGNAEAAGPPCTYTGHLMEWIDKEKPPQKRHLSQGGSAFPRPSTESSYTCSHCNKRRNGSRWHCLQHRCSCCPNCRPRHAWVALTTLERNYWGEEPAVATAGGDIADSPFETSNASGSSSSSLGEVVWRGRPAKLADAIETPYLRSPRLFSLSGGFALALEAEDAEGDERRYKLRVSEPPRGPIAIRILLCVASTEKEGFVSIQGMADLQAELLADGGMDCLLDGDMAAVLKRVWSCVDGLPRGGHLCAAIRVHEPDADTDGKPGQSGWIPWRPARPSATMIEAANLHEFVQAQAVTD